MISLKMKRKIVMGIFPALFELPIAVIPAYAFHIFAFFSIFISTILQVCRKKHESLFVGQWTPIFLLLGIYRRFLKLAGF